MLLEAGKDVTAEIDLTSMAAATSHTRGPANKKFEANYELNLSELDALIGKLLESRRPDPAL